MDRLNGTEYGITGLIFEIKRGATWQETFFFEGDLSNNKTLRGYLSKKQGGERLAEFVFSQIYFGNFTTEDGDPLIGYTTFRASLPASVTSQLPTTSSKSTSSQRAGKDYWECDLECVSGNVVIPLVSAIVYVVGEC
jgi:hypothetical protein